MSNKKRHSTWKIEGVVKMPGNIFFILLWNYQKEIESQPLRSAIVIFCGSMGHAMLSNEIVCNKLCGWNITSSFQNFILFILAPPQTPFSVQMLSSTKMRGEGLLVVTFRSRSYRDVQRKAIKSLGLWGKPRHESAKAAKWWKETEGFSVMTKNPCIPHCW